MSISYEEALSTLQSMFGETWSREDLDYVLRNQQGHMENTVDVILRHGDKDPQMLIDQLERGIDPEASTRAMDEQLARQLAQGEQAAARRQAATAGAASGGSSGIAAAPKGHGNPTQLPSDFLRIPGYQSTSGGAATNSSVMDDEALARMLQDELFSQELARNPDFAHLARGGGRPRTVGGMPVAPAMRGRAGGGGGASTAHGQQQRPQINLPQPEQIMGKINELGEGARRRLQMLAAQFNARNTSVETPGVEGRVSASERRGLLDDDVDDMELAARKDL